MLLLNDHFDAQGLIAFTTDSSRDYTLRESSPFLNAEERSSLGFFSVKFHQFAWARQVHGDRVLLVNDEFLAENVLHDADALVTNLKNVLIAVRTADCLPVFLWDSVSQSLGVVHAGWKSTHKKILHRAIETMTNHFQVNIADLQVAFGPVIRSCCYQVGPEFRENFPHAVVMREGKMCMDLIKANTDQLLSIGVKLNNIFDSRICTVCNPGYFSYRRDGEKAGRMISAMMLKG